MNVISSPELVFDEIDVTDIFINAQNQAHLQCIEWGIDFNEKNKDCIKLMYHFTVTQLFNIVSKLQRRTVFTYEHISPWVLPMLRNLPVSIVKKQRGRDSYRENLIAMQRAVECKKSLRKFRELCKKYELTQLEKKYSNYYKPLAVS